MSIISPVVFLAGAVIAFVLGYGLIALILAIVAAVLALA